MENMRATKTFRYSTRRLLPGDTFEATPKDAKLLRALRKAENVRPTADVPPPPPAVAAQIANNDMATLRAEYRVVFGRAPFNGWDAAQLRERIAAAKANV